MYIILIRHSESLKNIKKQFSSLNEKEVLTENGIMQAQNIASDLFSFIERKKLLCNNVYAANSIRSIDSAKIISQHLNAKIMIEDDFISTRPGALAGKTEMQAKSSNPIFIEQLNLFRKGLFNAYDFNVADGKEPKKQFEKRIDKCLDNILNQENESIKIIIGHRSSITYSLIRFARKFHNYPINFSGFVKLDLAKISIIKKLENSDNWKIICVNESSLKLNQE